MAGIGHNSGPTRIGRGWQKHCWSRSRKALIGKRMPIEVVRRRIKRARELGLAYPQYASILLGSGRDVVGFLFTVDGLHLKLQKRLRMPEQIKEKLQNLEHVSVMSFAPSGEEPALFRAELAEISGVQIAAVAPEPEAPLGWAAAREKVRAVLDQVNLPSDAVVLVGTQGSEELMAQAAKMARFVPSCAYFAHEV